MAWSPQNIAHEVAELATDKKIWVAFSGGVDSHVLLHLLVHHLDLSSEQLGAIHVDHGLHPSSKIWAQQCAEVANSFNVEFKLLTVKVKNSDKLGMEAAAREARYYALQNAVEEDDLLLTAQHQDDQAETVLLQLFRGAGPKGLSAMAQSSKLANVSLIRPLLTVSQYDIHAYAEAHQLKWIEDPSNSETQWNRNYIRHYLWPIIKNRWPSAAKTISRSAEHCAETSALLAQLAKQDCTLSSIEPLADSYSIPALLSLPQSRLRNVLRHLMIWNNHLLPSADILQSIIDDLCLAKQDSDPLISWTGVELRRYQNRLYRMSQLSIHDNNQQIECNYDHTIKLNNGRVLEWIKAIGKGVNKAQATTLKIQFRQGGERIKPQGSHHHKSLKHLFQEWQIPPWQRDRIPLVFCGDELVAVMGYCISEGYAVEAHEIGYTLQYSD